MKFETNGMTPIQKDFNVKQTVRIRSGEALYISLEIELRESGETVYVVGEESCCAVTKECFLTNPEYRANPQKVYNDALLYENPFEDTQPADAGEWRPLIEEFIVRMVPDYIGHQGFARVFPQWMPEFAYSHLGKEMFQQMAEGCRYIKLWAGNIMDFIPQEKEGAAADGE